MQDTVSADKMMARRSGAVGHMIFNNPAKHNAVSLDMWDAAERILDDFERDEAVRVVVLSGAGGKSFVSGADISKFESERSEMEAVQRYNERVAAMYARLEEFPKPTIAMIHGYCIGGGLNLAVCCDLRFCSESAQFAMPAAKLGLGYPFHAIRRLMAVMGPGAAKDLMFTGRRIGAEEALRIGLAQKVLPDGALDDVVADYAGDIAANAPLTIKAMKAIAGQVAKDPADRDPALCDSLVQACFSSQDYIEGRRAFMEKRKPNFTGR